MNLPEYEKVVPAGRGSVEADGWQAVPHLRIPQLLGWRSGDTTDHLIFEDIFTGGRCEFLLGDCITLADHGHLPHERGTMLINEVVGDLARSIELTGEHTTFSRCVPALYAHRCHPAGRLNTWYPPATALPVGPTRVLLGDLHQFALTVNGRLYHLDWTRMIDETRQRLAPGTRWLTALTQGDPTEPNIAYPLVWLDFEHAGRNTIAGEIANLLWYLLAMGGWLVPRYQPDVYARTLRRPLAPIATPQLTRLSLDADTIRLDYAWRLGTARSWAIRSALTAIEHLLLPALRTPMTGLLALMRPFLTMRILTVLPLTALQPHDALLCLAKLAQLHDPDTTPALFFDGIHPAEEVAP
jgi:hypothetical protein